MSNADTEKTTRDPTMGDHTRDILQASVAGVVRRDELREAVTALRDEWATVGPGTETERVFGKQVVSVEFVLRELSRILDAVPDVPPSHLDPKIIGNAEGNRKIRDADRAAARQELARGPVSDAPVCPECGVRRADWNVDGGRLPFCPNCGGDNPTERKP